MEHQAISISINGAQLHLYNIYIPPPTSCPPGFSPSLTPLLELDTHNTIIMGDFKAHNPAWYSTTQDDREAARGTALINQIDSSQYILLNQDTPTRLLSQGAPSSPDLTLISPHLALDAVWTPLARLNSDHLPISISLDSLNPPNNHPTCTYINFRQADWEGYTANTETAFSAAAHPSSCSQAEILFRRILTLAARRHIPHGCRRDFIPNLPPSLSFKSMTEPEPWTPTTPAYRTSTTISQPPFPLTPT
ncbi:hypothetical protein HAZT_HAZT008960 [Hyalella azteca]|uniref:Endonuclease/exonuclease/phosphatase domain-containing protein n=1 Tax=Hyalella azteca TaxID=294128 RepID=A0A6A0GRE3_HYAAZ|nr:hypothetical protein HAZT_HAZT008960 [Hyalella azteca]